MTLQKQMEDRFTNPSAATQAEDNEDSSNDESSLRTNLRSRHTQSAHV